MPGGTRAAPERHLSGAGEGEYKVRLAGACACVVVVQGARGSALTRFALPLAGNLAAPPSVPATAERGGTARLPSACTFRSLGAWTGAGACAQSTGALDPLARENRGARSTALAGKLVASAAQVVIGRDEPAAAIYVAVLCS